MANNPQGNPDKEISLYDVSLMIKRRVTRVNDSFYDGFLYIKRYIIFIIILLAAGIAYGIYLDSDQEVYDHKVFVVPNFESVDYLYGEVEFINSRLRDHDYEFFTKLGVENPGNISKLEIEPVVDIYDFIDDVEENDMVDRRFELFRLIAESGEMEDILKDEATSKNYTVQVVKIITSGKATDDGLVKPLMAHFNSDPYFMQVQEKYKESLAQEIAENEFTIRSIDSILSNSGQSGTRAGNSLYVSEERSLHEVIRQKRYILQAQEKNRVKQVNYNSIIKEGATVMNLKHKNILAGRMKVIVPLFLLFIFVCITSVISYYKSQKLKRSVA